MAVGSGVAVGTTVSLGVGVAVSVAVGVAVAGGAQPLATFSSCFVPPVGSPGMVTAEVWASTPARTADGPTAPLAEICSAAVPVTRGAAMLVPLLDVVPPPIAVERIAVPGATRATLAP